MGYRILSIEGNRQRLDGGAMFGNAPKALWSRWVGCDEENRIDLACRSFLIIDQINNRRILLETGIGAFFEPKLLDRYGVYEKNHVLLDNLNAKGYAADSIDFIILSHLHFDHAGGLLTLYQAGKTPTMAFPKAKVIVGAKALERAKHPHLRDRISFPKEIVDVIEKLEKEKKLIVLQENATHPLGKDFDYDLSFGHTPGQILTKLKTQKGSVQMAGDLIPGQAWLNAAITMGYDRFPEHLIDEKKLFCQSALREKTTLLFTHDAKYVATTLTRDQRGKIIADTLYESIDIEL